MSVSVSVRFLVVKRSFAYLGASMHPALTAIVQNIMKEDLYEVSNVNIFTM